MTTRAVRHRNPALYGALALTVVLASPVQGQSVFNAAGLGVPSEALDGRSRAMGSMGIGLPGGAFMPTDPGALGRLRFATGVVAGQPSWVEYSAEPGETGSFEGSRFPLLGVAYPLLGGMMSVQIGSFLDQHYRDTRTGSVDLSTGTLPFTDEFVQDGSVSNLNLGYARMFGGNVAMGVTAGRYAGSVVRTLTRTYGEEGVRGEVDSYLERGRWSYAGHHVTPGVSADLDGRLYLAASVQIPTALDADATDETEGADRSYDMPIQYRAGASFSFDFGLMLAASAALADWSGAQDDLVDGARAGEAKGFGVGLEFSRARLFGKDAPLRFGFRRSTLPFSFGADDVTERIFSGGFGLALNRTEDVTLAAVDLALERGRRQGMGIVENFWRATVSFQAAGF